MSFVNVNFSGVQRPFRLHDLSIQHLSPPLKSQLKKRGITKTNTELALASDGCGLSCRPGGRWDPAPHQTPGPPLPWCPPCPGGASWVCVLATVPNSQTHSCCPRGRRGSPHPTCSRPCPMGMLLGPALPWGRCPTGCAHVCHRGARARFYLLQTLDYQKGTANGAPLNKHRLWL